MSPRGGVWRQPNPTRRGDAQDPDTRGGTTRDERGRDREVLQAQWAEQVMKRVVERGNLLAALRRVKRHGGARVLTG